MIALSLTDETENINGEKWLFEYKLLEYKSDVIVLNYMKNVKPIYSDCCVYGAKRYVTDILFAWRIGKISVSTILWYVNFIGNKHIGTIKYELN